jgi:hypothetical protein
MGGRSEKVVGHALCPPTVQATRVRRNAEGDGVLAMLCWLNSSPESFVPGYNEADDTLTRLPEPPPGNVLRFGTRKIHAALDAQRAERNLTWAEVAREVGLSVSMLTYLAKGSRVGFPHVMRIMRWLGQPAANSTRAFPMGKNKASLLG